MVGTREAQLSMGKQNFGLARCIAVVVIGVIVAIAFSVLMPRKTENGWAFRDSGVCRFPAIYNFGDSNSDTGGLSAAFYWLPSPYGNSFFGKPSGRFSDGQVVIDFMAEKLGLPFLSAYLDSVGSDYLHGANFATGGSTIQRIDGRAFDARLSPISLDLQLLQFQQFKARTNELFSDGVTSRLPLPGDFSNALYTLDIGQNDLHLGFKFMTEEQARASIPNITHQFASVVEKLYQEGARAFWIHNTGPIGCIPLTARRISAMQPDKVDGIGCVKSHNEIAQEFNRQLKERVIDLRAKLTDAVLTYVDMYSAKFMLISEAKQHGFTDPLRYCCGHNGDNVVPCGMKMAVDGVEVSGDSCSDPSQHISWDGIHYSHAANLWIANKILDGSFSDPPVAITEACRKAL
ncbi:hypothetical protein EUGRSUZ_H02485 [Eucalyptus grandis]|uniref:Uncharacterized protein n=2 Tax=Eucalyptus grandis TaxID=71139 RepID=A0A059B0G4_EUCGR|nr:hypothetical protein EUGRSUZ_H02485 [Eucalyptus grandis]